MIGCGAIGLAMFMALKAAGANPIMSPDFSASGRELAVNMDADIAIDPAKLSPQVASPPLAGTTSNVIFE